MRTLSLLLSSGLLVGAANLALAADGGAAFKASCASCHGASGAGDTPVGKAMNIPAIAGKPAADVTKHVNEAANHATVKGKVSADDLTAIAAFVSGLE